MLPGYYYASLRCCLVGMGWVLGVAWWMLGRLWVLCQPQTPTLMRRNPGEDV